MAKNREQNGNKHNDRKRDHLVFIVCLVLAASFWFLIKLSDVYPVSYNLKIKYTHIPVGKLITQLKDSTVTVHFKSNGYNLLDLMLHRQLDSLAVDLSECDTRKTSGREYTVLTASLRETMAQRLGVNDRDLEFSKPMLAFYMEQLHKVKKKVIPLLNLKFKSQFRLYGYEVKPLRVKVYGPKQMLDTLKNIYTRVIRMEDLAEDKKIWVAIANPNPKMLRFYPDKVQVNLDVEKYTERSLTVPVDVSQIEPAIRTFPMNVMVNFNVFVRDYEKIQPGQFRVVPNIKNIDLRTVKKLRLELVSAPKKVSNIRLVPTEVEFIIVN
jgi:hypothetical protein